MYRRMRRISRDPSRFCHYCKCDACLARRSDFTQKEWREDRLRCRDGSYICEQCYHTACDSQNRGFCYARRQDGDCIHRPMLAKGEERKLPENERPGRKK